MRNLVLGLFLISISLVSVCKADQVYVDADIYRVEVCKATNPDALFIFLQNTAESTPTNSDGCSNDISLPYVRLEIGEANIANDAIISLAYTAYVSNKRVRIRYDNTDNQNKILAIAFK